MQDLNFKTSYLRRFRCLIESALLPGIYPSFLNGFLSCLNGMLAITLRDMFFLIFIATQIDANIGSTGSLLSYYGIKQQLIYLSFNLQHWNIARTKVFSMEF